MATPYHAAASLDGFIATEPRRVTRPTLEPTSAGCAALRHAAREGAAP